MPLTAEQRQGIIQDLTTNCDCWQGEGDAETLNALVDDKLVALGRQHTIAKLATTGFKDPIGNSYRVSPESGQWEGKKAAAPTQQVVNAKKKAVPPDEEDMDEDEEEDDDMAKESKRRMFGKKPKLNRKRPLSEDEWLESAPEHLVNSMRFAQQLEASEREKLITKLANNSSEGDRPARVEWLKTQPLDVLQNMATMIPAAAPTRPNRATTINTEEDNEVLSLPTINFGEEEDTPTRTRNQASQGFDAPAASSDEDYLATLPASVQNTVREAQRIENRERTQLIEQLTANVDEETADRLARRWANRPLDELRDLAAITPRKEVGRGTNLYFGAGAPLGNSGNRGIPGYSMNGGGMEDEVLPLPKLNFSNDADEERPTKKKRVAQ